MIFDGLIDMSYIGYVVTMIYKKSSFSQCQVFQISVKTAMLTQFSPKLTGEMLKKNSCQNIFVCIGVNKV